uniref:MLX-interacting protein n=1 Tax=Timema tahoe TaxID=61484 RepID=A0A7R9IES8_9NEOP|nr:unnamed protein product [Timema tahoe]
MKKNTLVCQFASPLDVDTHNKPEAVVLEGKYWKRKLAAVTAEYKKWRMFYRNRFMGWGTKDGSDLFTTSADNILKSCVSLSLSRQLAEMDMFDWQPHSNDSLHSMGSMMVDEDYMEFMSDTLFTSITYNQPFAFPDTREITRGTNIADFMQPSLVQLQPNLDDFMDTLEPLQVHVQHQQQTGIMDRVSKSRPPRSAQSNRLLQQQQQSASSYQQQQAGLTQASSTYQGFAIPEVQPQTLQGMRVSSSPSSQQQSPVSVRGLPATSQPVFKGPSPQPPSMQPYKFTTQQQNFRYLQLGGCSDCFVMAELLDTCVGGNAFQYVGFTSRLYRCRWED